MHHFGCYKRAIHFMAYQSHNIPIKLIINWQIMAPELETVKVDGYIIMVQKYHLYHLNKKIDINKLVFNYLYQLHNYLL